MGNAPIAKEATGRFFVAYGRAIGENPTRLIDYINGSMNASASLRKVRPEPVAGARQSLVAAGAGADRAIMRRACNYL